MIVRRLRSLAAAVVLLVAWAPPLAMPAFAQAPPNRSDDAIAADLKKEGDAFMSERRYADALAAYDAAYARAPSPVLHYNRGRALQFLARYPEALEALLRFKAEAPEPVRARVGVLEDLITELRGQVTTLDLRCNVEGAQIRLGDRIVGTTPLAKPLVVNAGEAQVQVTADGRVPYSRPLTLRGGETVVVEANLESATALLRVHSREAGAQVFVDGRPAGSTPTSTTVQPGMHSLRVEREGRDPGRTDVMVTAGDEKDIALDPIERPAITSRWWFWTGLGTLVVGGVVLGIALSTERAGDRGTFAPGSLRVP